jgi:hypothetical protein
VLDFEKDGEGERIISFKTPLYRNGLTVEQLLERIQETLST